MNTGEIDTFTARLARMTDKGVSLGDAERLADRLVIRDREGDETGGCAWNVPICKAMAAGAAATGRPRACHVKGWRVIWC